MSMPLKDLLIVAGLLMGVTVSVGLAMLYIFSRVRKASDALREEHIQRLETDRTELKADKVELEKLNNKLRDDISELRGQVGVLRDLVLRGHCKSFVLDPVTGGCTHCDLGLPPMHRRTAEDVRG